ncbi:MAG: macro domain-containing protein [Bacteroidales bacterium]|nr:macro domain-containing protein [Bacteroidales bacterium]
MIRYVKGNLLDSEAEALVNTVNTVGVMGKGLALQFKEQFPENYRKYREVCRNNAFHVGQLFDTIEHTVSGDKVIINFPTKTTWREPSKYSYIEEGLAALKRLLIDKGIKSVAIPPLGTRNGGLDWDRVRQMIVDSLSDLECDIIVYEPNEVIVERMRAERVRLTPARAMMLDVLCDLVSQGEVVSEFAAEKVVYFLQRFGAENVFKLNFQPAYYGPYSGKVRYVLRYLNGSYLMGLEEMSQRPFEPIWLLPEIGDYIMSFFMKDGNIDYAKISEKTKGFLSGFYSNYSLEILSTIDFILRHDPALFDWKDKDRDFVIEKVHDGISQWSNRKDRLFGEERNIGIVVDHLKTWDNKFY